MRVAIYLGLLFAFVVATLRTHALVTRESQRSFQGWVMFAGLWLFVAIMAYATYYYRAWDKMIDGAPWPQPD